MRIRLSIWLETLRSRLWFIPALFAGGAALAAIVMVTIDRTLGPDATGPFQFGGGPESARSILSTIAASMLSFTGLVFSVTMLVLQLASSQLSPRVTRTFLRDRKNQIVLGVFVATFVYALLVLREVRSVSDLGFVPSIAVWWSFILLLASIVAFIYYVDHMAHAMRASTVIASVAAETRAAIERRYPDPLGSEPVAALPFSATSATILGPDRPGVVQAIDVERLRRLAADSDTVLEALVQVGDALPGAAPIASVHGDGRVDADAVRVAFTVGDRAHDGPGPRVRPAPARRYRRPGPVAGHQRPDHGPPGRRPAPRPAPAAGSPAHPVSAAGRRRRRSAGHRSGSRLGRPRRPRDGRDPDLRVGLDPGRPRPASDARRPRH